MKPTVVFLSSSRWNEYAAKGFRTRQGALLKAFACSGFCEHLIVVTETGFRGRCGVSQFNKSNYGIKITEIFVPGKLPEFLLRPLRRRWLQANYQFPEDAVSLLENCPPDLIWSYSAGLGTLLHNITSAPTFYDVVDYRVTDTNLSAWQQYLWRKELTAACSSADWIVCNGEFAYQKLLQHVNDKCVLLRNGVEPDRFRQYRDQEQRRGVGFVGVISYWIDFELVDYLVSKLSMTSFEFYGIVNSAEKKLHRLMRHQNFHWLGELSPHNVPKFLAQCQVAIVPYNPKMTIKTLGDSMKIFEYLAAGTPVVSTRFQADLSKRFSGLIEICDSYDQFTSAVSGFIEHTPSQYWQEKSWDFVSDNTWQARIKQILDFAEG